MLPTRCENRRDPPGRSNHTVTPRSSLKERGLSSPLRTPNPWCVFGLFSPFFFLGVGDFGRASPAAGVKAGRRPPGGLGLDAGEDGARLRGRYQGGSTVGGSDVVAVGVLTVGVWGVGFFSRFRAGAVGQAVTRLPVIPSLVVAWSAATAVVGVNQRGDLAGAGPGVRPGSDLASTASELLTPRPGGPCRGPCPGRGCARRAGRRRRG
jgi:hypothetical protein